MTSDHQEDGSEPQTVCGYMYHVIKDVERLERYCPGGYHPVKLGDIFRGRYEVVDKLGHGGYSTIWLAFDREVKRFVAAKIGKADSPRNRQETETMRDLSSHYPVQHHCIDRELSPAESASLSYNLLTEESVFTHESDTHSSASTNGSSQSRSPSPTHPFALVSVLAEDSRPQFNLPEFGRNTIPAVLDEFEIEGPNGIHPCFTVHPALGNLKDFGLNTMFPLHVARALSAGLAVAVFHVHSRGYVHGDIHLRNALVKLPPRYDTMSETEFRAEIGEPETETVVRFDGKPVSPNVPSEAVLPLGIGRTSGENFTLAEARDVLLNDFGESWAPAKETRLGKDCCTPAAMRAPEAFFEPDRPLSFPSDVWSLATAIWDIVGMRFPFCEGQTENYLVSQQIDIVGEEGFPAEWWENWGRKNEFFVIDSQTGEEGNSHKPTNDANGKLRQVWPSLAQSFEDDVQVFRRNEPELGVFSEEETKAFLDLMRQMMKFRPEERLTMEEVLASEWMVKWAMPELQRAVMEEDQIGDGSFGPSDDNATST